MADYGIKIAKPGKPITSADIRDYILWSKYQTLKIHSQGSGRVTIPIGSTYNDVNIAHGLSFIPAYLVFSELKDGSGKWFLNHSKLATGDADADEQYVNGGFSSPPPLELGLYVDATNLRIEYGTYDNSIAHDIDYYYFIFGNKGS